MAFGIAAALVLLAAPPSAAASYGPAPAPEPKPVVKTADTTCVTPPPSGDSREILVCAQRPQGYRLNRDVMEAHREKRSAGRPTPRQTMRGDSCQTVGTMGCIGAGAGINVLAAAATAAEMAARLSKGQEIGSMFKTTPDPTEYDLYVAAKKRREAEEAAASAKAKPITAAGP